MLEPQSTEKATMSPQADRLLAILKDNPIDTFDNPTPTLRDYGQVVQEVDAALPSGMNGRIRLPHLLRAIESNAFDNAYNQYHATFSGNTDEIKPYMSIGDESKDRTLPFVKAALSDPELTSSIGVSQSREQFLDLSIDEKGSLLNQDVDKQLFQGSQASTADKQAFMLAVNKVPHSAQQVVGDFLRSNADFGMDFNMAETRDHVSSILGRQDQAHPKVIDTVPYKDLFNEAIDLELAKSNLHQETHSQPEPDVAPLSPTSARFAQVIETNALNAASGFSIDTLAHHLVDHDSVTTKNPVSSGVKTAALVSRALQTVYESASGYDETVIAFSDDVKHSAQEIIRAAYDDPQINPHKTNHGGGYLDINKALNDMDRGKELPSSILPKSMSPENKYTLLDAASKMPENQQQIIIQGFRAAAEDAKRTNVIGGVKTDSIMHSVESAQSNITALHNYNTEIGYVSMGQNMMDRFDREVYDAKGRTNHRVSTPNPNLASNQPSIEITADLGGSLLNDTAKGINEQLKIVQDLHKQPHTKLGDFNINEKTSNLLDDVSSLAESLNDKYDQDEKAISRENAQGYLQVSSVVDRIESLSKEMPSRNVETERKVDRAKDSSKENFQKAVDIVISKQDNAQDNTVDAPKVKQTQQQEPQTNLQKP